jgi:hypothetical protein
MAQPPVQNAIAVNSEIQYQVVGLFVSIDLDVNLSG